MKDGRNPDPVARYFFSLMDNRDIKTDYNFLDLTDKPDSVRFLSDNQATNKLKAGKTIDELFADKGNATSVGRIVKKTLTDNQFAVNDKMIEDFVNKFRSYSSFDEKKETLKLISGEEVKNWYYLKQYSAESLEGRGTLGNSCMRHSHCREFFDIYTKNPEQVKLLILTDDQNKLKARALLWQTTEGTYLDRIYFTIDFEKEIFRQYAANNSINFGYDIKQIPRKILLTIKGDYPLYPYMDTFKFYYKDDGILFNYDPRTSPDSALILSKKSLLFLQKTDGTCEPQDIVQCRLEGVSVREEDAIFSNFSNTYVTRANAVFSKTANSYLFNRKAKMSKKFEDYLPENACAKVYFDKRGIVVDYYPNDEIGKSIVLVNNFKGVSGYFPIDYKGLIKIGEKYYFSDGIMVLYNISKGDKDKLTKFYQPNKDRLIASALSTMVDTKCTELDATIFGFELDMNTPPYVATKDEYLKTWYRYASEKNMAEILEEIELKKIILNKKLSEIKKANTILLGKFYSYTRKNFIEMNPKEVEVWKLNFDENYEKAFKLTIKNFEEYHESVYNSIKNSDKETIEKIVSDNIYNFKYAMYAGETLFYRYELSALFATNKEKYNIEYYSQMLYKGIYKLLLKRDTISGNFKKYFGLDLRYVDSSNKVVD